ncbi:MAG TPA: hypothetical protein VI669_11225 [Vicinamibacteria bacterium]
MKNEGRMFDLRDSAALSPEQEGRAEAEAFERRLREIEANERDQILTGAGSQHKGRATEYQPAMDIGRMKTRMEELVAFRNAVQESLVWRAAQALRRMFGRAW